MVASNRQSLTRPNWVSREQVNVGDQTAISTSADQSLQAMLGALVGNANGVTSPFTFTYSAGVGIYTVSFSAFQFYMSTPALTTSGGDIVGWNGSLYNYDPTALGQTNVWSVAAARAGAAAGVALTACPYIYARPQSVQTDVDARVIYSSGRTVTAMPTRVRPVIEIKFSSAVESDPTNEGWCRVGQITSWSAFGSADPGTPTLTPISFWDDPAASATVGESAEFVSIVGSPPLGSPSRAQLLLQGITAGDAGNSIYNTQPQKTLGLVEILTVLRSRFTLLLSADSTYTWIAKMASGMTIKGLKASVDALQNALTAQGAKLGVSPVLASGKVSSLGVLQRNSSTVLSASQVGTGQYVIQLSFPASVLDWYAVHITGDAPGTAGVAGWGTVSGTPGTTATLYVYTYDAPGGSAQNSSFYFSVLGAYA